MRSKILFPAAGLLALCGLAQAQVFVAGMAGTAALSGASVVRATPPAAANYDPKVGLAVNIAVGYHLNDWVSAQAGYIWNRNLLINSHLTGSVYSQSKTTQTQTAAAFDAMLYFRPRPSRLRPYLSAGLGVIDALNEHTAGLRVAVGIDVALGKGWGLRYSFSEMASANPYAAALRPPAGGKLMNFQNLFGVMKTF